MEFTTDKSLIKLKVADTGHTIGQIEYDIGRIASDCIDKKMKIKVPFQTSKNQKGNLDCGIELSLVVSPNRDGRAVHTMSFYEPNPRNKKNYEDEINEVSLSKQKTDETNLASEDKKISKENVDSDGENHGDNTKISLVKSLSIVTSKGK